MQRAVRNGFDYATQQIFCTEHTYMAMLSPHPRMKHTTKPQLTTAELAIRLLERLRHAT